MGRTLARRGLGLVYGGGSVGLMGAVADAALAAGRRGGRRHPAGAPDPRAGPPVAHHAPRGRLDARAQGADGRALRRLRGAAGRDGDAGGALRGAHLGAARAPRPARSACSTWPATTSRWPSSSTGRWAPASSARPTGRCSWSGTSRGRCSTGSRPGAGRCWSTSSTGPPRSGRDRGVRRRRPGRSSRRPGSLRDASAGALVAPAARHLASGAFRPCERGWGCDARARRSRRRPAPRRLRPTAWRAAAAARWRSPSPS